VTVCWRCTEIGVMAGAGECLERIAERLDPPMKPENVITHLNRHGRKQLAERIPRLLDVRPTTYR
jgi:hypothetical protein